MTAKHTPGPWSVCEHSWCETSISAPSTDHAICRLDINHATEESQEADEAQMAANARLIAAAPELLEALRIAREFMSIASDWNFHEAEINGEMRSTYDWLAVVDAAIAKATGGQT